MRYALILAFVGSVILHANTVEARSDVAPAAQARKTPKPTKRSAAKSRMKAKVRNATHKGSKRSHKAPVEAALKVASAADGDTPAPAREVVAPAPAKRPAVAQSTDDEEPANAPKKR